MTSRYTFPLEIDLKLSTIISFIIEKKKKKNMEKGYGFLLQIIDKNEFLIKESRVFST